MAKTQFRVGGAYTRLTWTDGSGNAKTLAYVDVLRETAPRAVQNPQPIQPLDQQYPIEIALPGAVEAGTIEVSFREQWDAEVWNAFYSTYYDNTGTTQNIADLLGIFKAQLQAGNSGVSLQKLIIDPTTYQTIRYITYNNPVITSIMGDETVNIGTMTFAKSVQFTYLSRTETYVSPTNNTSPWKTASKVVPANSFE
jgi:hypothetical protein